MNEKDAAVIKILAELGLRKEEPLTLQQEQLFKRAIDPEEEYLYQLEQIFCEQDDEFENLPSDEHHKAKMLAATRHEIDIIEKRMGELVRSTGLSWGATGLRDMTTTSKTRKRHMTSVINPFPGGGYHITLRLNPQSSVGIALRTLNTRLKKLLNREIDLEGSPSYLKFPIR